LTILTPARWITGDVDQGAYERPWRSITASYRFSEGRPPSPGALPAGKKNTSYDRQAELRD